MSDYIEETTKIMKQLEEEVTENGSIAHSSFDKVGRLMEIIYNQDIMIDMANQAANKFKEEADSLEAEFQFIRNANNQMKLKEEN
jgi:hypothetical protein